MALAEQFPSIDLRLILELVTSKAELVRAKSLSEPVCVDPDDDKFLACALKSKCKVIVSGDKHLLHVSGLREIRVLKPREFVDEFISNL